MKIFSVMFGKSGTAPARPPLPAPLQRSSFVSSLAGLNQKAFLSPGDGLPKGGGRALIADAPGLRKLAAESARESAKALRLACFNAISPMRKAVSLVRKGKARKTATPGVNAKGYLRQPDLMQAVSIRPPAPPPRPKLAPPCQTILDDDRDETELMKASPYRAARLRERARIKAIMEAPEAKGLRDAAAHLAFQTNTGRFTAIRLLANMPAGAAVEMDRDPYPRGIPNRGMARRGGF